MPSFSFVDVVLIFFATYRISVMLYHDDELGPSQIVYRLKLKLGVKETVPPQSTSEHPSAPGPPLYGYPGTLQEAVLCYFCNSPWIGFILAAIVLFIMPLGVPWLYQAILLPFAASGFTVLLARYTE